MVTTAPKPACPVCARESRDWLLCNDCTKRLVGYLEEIPGLVRDLRITYTRQQQFGIQQERVSGGGLSASIAGVPFDSRADAVKHAITNTIGTWMRALDAGDLFRRTVVCTCQPYKACQPTVRIDLIPGPRISGWCAWLIERKERIRGAEGVEQMFTEIEGHVRHARRVMDKPGSEEIVGSCPVCKVLLYARKGETHVTCKACKRAGIDELESFSVEASRAHLLSEAEDRLATVAQVAIILASFGLPVRAHTVQDWAKTSRGGRLIRRGADMEGRALYRVGDVADLVRDQAARKSNPTRRTLRVSGTPA